MPQKPMQGNTVMFLARIYISLKQNVSDPQGQTIQMGLRQLGFSAVNNVRSGKYFEICLEESDPVTAEAKIEDMCRKLLANPTIETYRYDLVSN